MTDQSLFAELRKRKVVQAAAIYGAVAWGVTEIVVTVVEQLFLPQWVATLAVIFFVVGFPVAMFLSWTFDLTAEGIRRTSVSSRRGSASIAVSIALLLAGTAGLFFLIKPGLDNRASPASVAAIAPNSLAVLPFDYSGPNPDDSYLGPGLSDELRDQLGRVNGLHIAARSSSIAAVEGGTDARGVAQKLGVAHVLEGNMRRHGNLLRVSVQLVDGGTGLAVWNESFDRGRAELLNVQQDIARAVANALLPDASPDMSTPITTNATANEKMLLARHYEQQALESETVDPNLLERAIRLYREAVELDPDSALAHSRLAGALLLSGDIDAGGTEAYKALDLDPQLAEAHLYYGQYLFARGRPNVGETLARAIELNPNLPDALATYAHWYWFNVGAEGVAEFYEKALRLDPLNVTRYGALGIILALSERKVEALAVVSQMRALFDGPTAYRAIAKIFELLGEVDHAIAWTILARNAQPDNPLHVEKLAEYFVDIGDFKTAETLIPDLSVGLLFKMRRYDEMIGKASDLMIEYPEDIQLRTYLAFAYSFVGDYGNAIRLIETSGLLSTVRNGFRGTEEWDGFMALVNAAYGRGEVAEARELAEWAQDHDTGGDMANWYQSVNNACFAAIRGDDAKAHEWLERALHGAELAWEPMLKDDECFERFQDDPVYQATVRYFDERRAALRKQLPATLRQYGVVL
jgi:TolB-like protein/tetratricopeptide (TPR) repeat protein